MYFFKLVGGRYTIYRQASYRQAIDKLLAISLALLLSSGLSGCVTQPPTVITTPQQVQLNQQHLIKIMAIKQFSLKGRIAVNTEGKGYSGGLSWAHHSNTDKIEMFSPLGGKVSEITKNSVEVVLTTSDGKQFNAADAETLTQNTMGWRLPLSGLSDWVLGRPAVQPAVTTDADVSVNTPPVTTLDSLGRITTLKQDDWDIEYTQYADHGGYSLPNKIVLRSPKVTLKLIVEQWNGLSAEALAAQSTAPQTTEPIAP